MQLSFADLELADKFTKRAIDLMSLACLDSADSLLMTHQRNQEYLNRLESAKKNAEREHIKRMNRI